MTGQQDRSHVLKILNSYKINKEVIYGLEMSGVDLAYTDLSEVMGDCIQAVRVNLRASSLIGASFLDCDFEETDFSNSNLEKIDMGDCVLNGANLYKAFLKGAKINISMCRGTCFDEVDFSGGEVIGSSFSNSSFSNSSFKNANLSRINAQQASFSSANLTGATLKEGNFKEADFRNTILDGVVWTGALIDGAIFDEGVMEIVKSKL